MAGEDANGFGCEWEKLHANGKKSTFQFTTTSAEQWNVRLAIRWAIAEAAGGKVDQPLIIVDSKGGKHTVASPGTRSSRTSRWTIPSRASSSAIRTCRHRLAMAPASPSSNRWGRLRAVSDVPLN